MEDSVSLKEISYIIEADAEEIYTTELFTKHFLGFTPMESSSS